MPTSENWSPEDSLIVNHCDFGGISFPQSHGLSGRGGIPKQHSGSLSKVGGIRETITVSIRVGSRLFINSVQFISVTQPWPTLCDPMDCSTPGLPVHHQLLESTQTYACWVSVAIQPSHPPPSPSPPSLNLSQHQSLFKWVNSSHQVAKVLEFQLQHQSFQWIFRTDFL